MEWTLRDAPFALSDIAYGNGIFVAISRAQTKAVYSLDGINWNQSNTPFAGHKICFGNGLFVCTKFSTVSSTQRIMTTANGFDWTLQTTPNIDFNSIAFGNGLFVCPANADYPDRVAISSNGINWTTKNTGIDSFKYWSGITYGNGIFVVVAQANSSTECIMTSSNGINWTLRNTDEIHSLFDIAFGNGLFVASGNGVTLTSSNGINWTTLHSVYNKQFFSITFGDDLFVAISGDDITPPTNLNVIITSINGIDWIGYEIPISEVEWRGIIYGNGQFIAVASYADFGTTEWIIASYYSSIATIHEKRKILNIPIIGFKHESRPYTPENLIASDHHYSINNEIKIMVDIENYLQEINTGNFSKFASITGKRTCAVNFSIDLYTMSDTTIAPSYFDLLQSCGWKKLSVENGVIIFPDSLFNSYPATVEVSFPEEINEPRQIVYKISGSMGSVKFICETGKPIKAEYSFIGALDKIYTREFENMIVPENFDNALPIALLEATFQLFGNDIPLQSFEINSGEIIELFSNIMKHHGCDGTRIVDRNTFGTLEINSDAEIPADFYERIINNGQDEMILIDDFFDYFDFGEDDYQ